MFAGAGRALSRRGEIPGLFFGLCFGVPLGYLARLRTQEEDPAVVPSGWERVRMTGVLRYRGKVTGKQQWTVDDIIEFRAKLRMEEAGIKTDVDQDYHRVWRKWRLKTKARAYDLDKTID
mmetsp:Transcript_8221/g.30910  ORF Transcript_8221/g.30910 Transcript_8221/m.30910 type:complete len:120 (-) Transcript_8221:1576-1935(-)